MAVCASCGGVLGSTDDRCPTCGAASPPADAGALPPADSGINHFFRLVGVNLCMFLASVLPFAGLVWLVLVLDRTGYRKRDALLLLIPFVGFVLDVRVMWRYTARHVYWTTRADRRSAVIAGWPRRLAIGAGLAWPVLALGAANLGLFEEEWTPEDRAELIADWEANGWDRATATCIADELIERFPDPAAPVGEAEGERAVDVAIETCTAEDPEAPGPAAG